MKIAVTVRRQASRHAAPYDQTYEVETDPQTNTVLDVLHKIQWEQDGTLVFRRNCRNVICGSCGMRMGGKAGLACQKHASEVLVEREGQLPELLVEPMGNLPVIRDLIVDMSKFWQNLERVDPYVATAARQVGDREFLQTPAQREKLQAAANCILCGSCYSDCNAALVNPQFVGPHALAKAYRVLADNRDTQTRDRTAKYDSTDFVWGCTRCFNCNEVCPVGVQPLDRIAQVKQAVLQRDDLPDSTARRHRRTMVELVREEGWIDESKFGVRVVGNNFRDWRGLLSLVPLGVRAILSGKMPWPWQFRPSKGRASVRALIAALTEKLPR